MEILRYRGSMVLGSEVRHDTWYILRRRGEEKGESLTEAPVTMATRFDVMMLSVVEWQ